MKHMPHGRDSGQTLVEFALVLPLFLLVLFGIIVLGIGVFYQQQLTNAAREAARFASIHSASAACPVTGSYDPASPPLSYPRGTPVGGCDRKLDGWPLTTEHARNALFGIDRNDVRLRLCWSGYRLGDATGAIDAPPPGIYPVFGEISSVFVQCRIDGVNPAVDANSIRCQDGMPTTDEASSQSEAPERPTANTVTAYACYLWKPPLAGFLLIPDSVTLRATVTQPLERQQ